MLLSVRVDDVEFAVLFARQVPVADDDDVIVGLGKDGKGGGV